MAWLCFKAQGSGRRVRRFGSNVWFRVQGLWVYGFRVLGLVWGLARANGDRSQVMLGQKEDFFKDRGPREEW